LYHPVATPASWADGARVVLGEDSIDFDKTLSRADESAGTVTLLVRHVPPKEPQIKLPAEWMREPASDTPNNWVNVVKQADGYLAQVGKETFDVMTTLSLVDGRILSGTIDNLVVAHERDCGDAALKICGPPGLARSNGSSTLHSNDELVGPAAPHQGQGGHRT
jgi:hypothetical protein